MEYYWLILNRTFLILLTDTKLIGIKVNGPIGAQSSDPIVNLLPLAIDGDLQNPNSYINMKYIERIKDVDLLSESFLRTFITTNATKLDANAIAAQRVCIRFMLIF